MTSTRKAYGLSSVLASLIAVGALTVAAPAFAGSCPAGKETTTNGQKPGATAHKDVTEKLLGLERHRFGTSRCAGSDTARVRT